MEHFLYDIFFFKEKHQTITKSLFFILLRFSELVLKVVTTLLVRWVYYRLQCM